MNELDLFNDVFLNYNIGIDDINNANILELWNNVKSLNIKDVRFFFFKLFVCYREQQYEKVWQLIREDDEYINRQTIDTLSKCIIHRNGVIIEINTRPYISNLYFYAAEACARIHKKDSEIFYQKYQFWKCQTSKPEKLKEKEYAIVYSFRKFSEFSLSDLIDSQITCCSPSRMNDPLDSLVYIWASEENMYRICKEKEHIKPYLKSFSGYRIRCFSANKNFSKDDRILKKILMWSHYADEHRGFCIRYRLSDRFIKYASLEDNNFCALKPVSYKNDVVIGDKSTINTKLAFETKAKCWEYEHEVRLIDYNPKIGDYVSINLDSDSVIEEIIFGCRCSNEVMKTIINVSRKLPYGKNIIFSKMKIDIKESVFNLLKENVVFEDYVSQAISDEK